MKYFLLSVALVAGASAWGEAAVEQNDLLFVGFGCDNLEGGYAKTVSQIGKLGYAGNLKVALVAIYPNDEAGDAYRKCVAFSVLSKKHGLLSVNGGKVHATQARINETVKRSVRKSKVGRTQDILLAAHAEAISDLLETYAKQEGGFTKAVADAREALKKVPTHITCITK